jgi:hypothetical protein
MRMPKVGLRASLPGRVSCDRSYSGRRRPPATVHTAQRAEGFRGRKLAGLEAPMHVAADL